MSSALQPSFSKPTVSFETELPEGIESWGPFDPINPANLPPPIRPGSPTTIKIRRDFLGFDWILPTLSASDRVKIREGKKPELVRRCTISGEDPATRETRSRLRGVPFLQRAMSTFVGDRDKNQSTAANTDDARDADQGSDHRKDSRPSSSGSEKTERRFSIFKRAKKVSRSPARPRVDQRSQLRRTRTAASGRDADETFGTSFNDRLRLVYTLNDLFKSSSYETTPSGTDTETSLSPLDPSPRTSLSCPSPMAQVSKEPEPQWLPMGSAMVAWTSVPRSSTWLKDLEGHLGSSQKVIQSLPRETQSAISELRQQQASRKPGREVYFVERPGKVFDLRTWDENAPVDRNEDEESTYVAEGDEANGPAERPGGLRQRMDSARASISKSLQRLVGRKNSNSTAD
ncbi:hypothetical protein HDK77DRAFT_486116 [Phyllosticta capitalensis]|uniref:Uncharacterized protein n=1 Tax=Phyllosticta capitalensis TaxID=121624 RepID=A0ABR1YDI3_9PEZI